MQGQTAYKHTSRTYFDVYNALVAAYPNKPTWLFKEFAGGFEFWSELMNRVARDIMYPNTREAAYAFADRCDYSPVEADGATATVTITLAQAMVKTLSAGYQVGGVSSSTGSMVLYELTAAASSGGTDTITASVRQKKTVTDVVLGTVETQDDWMEFPIDGYTKVLKDTITLEIDSQAWTRVDNFDASESTDRHFRLIYQSDGKARVRFGDGTNGQKPTLNKQVLATFAITEGLQGRLSASEIDTNVGQDADVSSVTNAADTSGGNNAESVTSIIRNSRINVRTRNVVWSKEDVELKAKEASSSVVKALAIPGVGATVIHVIPSGGGNPSSGLKTTVQTYVQSYTQFGLMVVTVSDPTYVSQAPTANITVRDGYTAGTVQDLTEFALTLVSSAIDNQVIESYLENGIDTCRTDVINNVWAWAFTEDENEALEFIINQWITLLGDRDYREWGQPLEVGNLWRMGDSLFEYGVDTFDLTSPTTNQTTTSTQIIDNTSSTVTVV